MIEFLKSLSLFQGISIQELKSVESLLEEETYKKGEWIFQEGERGDAFYIVKMGSVGIFKKDPSDGLVNKVGSCEAKEGFGETVFLEEEKRDSSALALENVEVIKIPLKSLVHVAEFYPIFSALSLNFAKQVTKRLQATNKALAGLMQEERSLLIAQDQMSRLIVDLFILLTLFFYVVRITDQARLSLFIDHSLCAILIVGFGVMCCLLVTKSSYPLEFYGLTLKNGWKHVKEAFILTLPILMSMVVVKAVLISTVPGFKELGLFGLTTHHSGFFLSFWHHTGEAEETARHFWTFLSLYLVLVPVQEFIARGCLQGCLYNFFKSPHRAVSAIVTSNLLFTLFHGLKTASFSLSACLLGFFWGWLYHKQHSIVGVSLSHILVGAWAFGVLNFQSILIY